MERDLGDRRRYGEDDVEVRHRQQIGLAVRQPIGTSQALALWAMPVAAGIIRDADLAAAVALLDVTAQGCRAAGFDGAHDAALAVAQMASMGNAVSAAVMAEDIRHLQRAAHGAQPGGITSICKPSSGLGVPAIRLVATRV